MSDTPTPAEIAAKVLHDMPESAFSMTCANAVIAALSDHYHLLPRVEAHRMRVGLIDMAPEDEMFPGDEPVLTVRFSADIPRPGRLFDLDELAAALMAAHSSEVSNV
ncbi:hypothetical protein SEA_APHELION_114 [Gordonia phage Aphelion]|uniref:Uncharacterized protein n=1 Tax=Gordonia phage Aphelion TaxID=2507860 RepID=A0A410TD78_9CAUD|nr:hypothetical protein SEA_APHELION_114 [Gordonia phage Aphelion]